MESQSQQEVDDFLDRRAQEMQLQAYAEGNALGNLTKVERAWLKVLAKESKRIRDTEDRDMTQEDVEALRSRVFKPRHERG
jgi:hypothetical protein